MEGSRLTFTAFTLKEKEREKGGLILGRARSFREEKSLFESY